MTDDICRAGKFAPGVDLEGNICDSNVSKKLKNFWFTDQSFSLL